VLDLCPPHLATGSIPYWSGVLTQIIQWALRFFSISVEQPCLAPCNVCWDIWQSAKIQYFFSWWIFPSAIWKWMNWTRMCYNTSTSVMKWFKSLEGTLLGIRPMFQSHFRARLCRKRVLRLLRGDACRAEYSYEQFLLIYELKTSLSACTQSVREHGLCVENGKNEHQKRHQSHS
jgi:hypothetical protein